MPFGYAAAISDVRLTLDDDTTLDCLQKIYPVGRFLAMGFAGSLKIGARMVARLTELLHCDDPEMAWDPTKVAEWWPAEARQTFLQFPDADIQRGCELILLSAHPCEDIGIPQRSRCFVHRFRAPDFVAELARPSAAIPVASEIVAIGCGVGVEHYREALQHAETTFTHLQMEVGNPGGTAFGLMTAVRAAIEHGPDSSISPYVQICIVQRGGVFIQSVNRVTFGSSVGDLVMPPLITDLTELDQMLGGAGAIAGARC